MSVRQSSLLDFAFLEFDMLFGNRVVLFQNELFGHRAGILFRHVEKARISRRVEADFDSCWLRHDEIP